MTQLAQERFIHVSLYCKTLSNKSKLKQQCVSDISELFELSSRPDPAEPYTGSPYGRYYMRTRFHPAIQIKTYISATGLFILWFRRDLFLSGTVGLPNDLLQVAKMVVGLPMI